MLFLDDHRDIHFNLLEWLDLDAVLKGEPYQDVDREQLGMVLDEALKVSKGSVAACNEVGDRVGAVLPEPQFPAARHAWKADRV